VGLVALVEVTAQIVMMVNTRVQVVPMAAEVDEVAGTLRYLAQELTVLFE
jgi:hypothetical protein